MCLISQHKLHTSVYDLPTLLASQPNLYEQYALWKALWEILRTPGLFPKCPNDTTHKSNYLQYKSMYIVRNSFKVFVHLIIFFLSTGFFHQAMVSAPPKTPRWGANQQYILKFFLHQTGKQKRAGLNMSRDEVPSIKLDDMNSFRYYIAVTELFYTH